MKFLLCFVLIILFCEVLLAEEAGKSPIVVNGDQVEFLPNEQKVVGSGNITIDYEDIHLTCNKIVVYNDTKDVDAGGDVVLKMPTGELKGERVKYNFSTKKGTVLNAKAVSGQWFGYGEEIDILSKDSYKVINGYITSCDLPNPHYKISSKSVTIYSDNRVTADNVIIKAGNVPIGYLPKYHYSLKADWPTISVLPGKKKNWGVFLLNSYRYEFDEKNKLTLRVDERQKWGLGEGFDYKYSFGNFGNGIIKTYYTNQRDKDRQEPLKGEEQRWRGQLRHRWDIEDKVTTFIEYHKLSDANMTKDFFYREEYDKEASPESYIYTLYKQPEYSASFLTRKRVNRFQTVVERLPEFRFNLKDQRIMDMPLYFKTDSMAVNLNKETIDGAEDISTLRFDTINKLSLPFRCVDFISLTPYAGMHDTAYSRNNTDDDAELRAAFFTGIDASSKFSRVYDVTGEFLGVGFNKLLHIVTPSVKYEYIHQPSVDYLKLQQFDDVDSLDTTSKFSLVLENKLKTKRGQNSGLTSVDLGYLAISSDYLYNPEGMGSQFSNVNGDLELTPFEWMTVESDTRYDPDTRDFQTWNNDFYVDNKDKWRIGVGSRYWQNEETELTSEWFYKLNDKWSFRTFARYDLKQVEDSGNKIINRFNEKELTILKDLHCWIAEMSVSSGRDGGTSLWFVMKLKASPKIPFDFKDYYPAPKR